MYCEQALKYQGVTNVDEIKNGGRDTQKYKESEHALPRETSYLWKVSIISSCCLSSDARALLMNRLS